MSAGLRLLVMVSLALVSSESVAEDAGDGPIREIGGYVLTEEQIETARKLASDAQAVFPFATQQAIPLRPKPRPKALASAARPAQPPQSANLSLENSTVLSPPARLIGVGRDIPLRMERSKDAQVVKLVRDQVITTQVITDGWYLVVLSGEFFFVHRSEVLSAPR